MDTKQFNIAEYNRIESTLVNGLLTVSALVLTLTIPLSGIKDITLVDNQKTALLLCWIFSGVSIIAGMFHNGFALKLFRGLLESDKKITLGRSSNIPLFIQALMVGISLFLLIYLGWSLLFHSVIEWFLHLSSIA